MQGFKPFFTAVGYWWVELAFILLDLFCLPDIYETMADLVKGNTRRMSHREIEQARTVYGEAIDYRKVRIDERAGIACKNYHIAYVSFYTLNSWGRFDLDILIHELMHVWQYRKFGAVYIPRALRAQVSPHGYNYGGVVHLKQHITEKRSLMDFNLEQQAEIMTDYYRLKNGKQPIWGNASQIDLPIYEHFVNEIRRP